MLERAPPGAPLKGARFTTRAFPVLKDAENILKRFSPAEQPLRK